MQLPQILSNQNIGAETNSANARELHSFLNSEQQYADWIKNRIAQYGFTLNQDYVIQTTYTGRRPRKEYFITLNMAKELCMVENNDKGKEARQYFIKCEQELQALKFEKYVSEVANLNACLIDKAKRHRREIAGYKGQITQHNALITSLRKDLALARANPQASEDLQRAYDRLKRDYEGLGKDWDGLTSEYMSVCKERNELKKEIDKRKYNQDKITETILALDKIRKHLDPVYTALGAVMAYASDDDRFFMDRNEILR